MDIERFDSLADEVRRAHDEKEQQQEPPSPAPPSITNRIKPSWLAIAILIAAVLAESVLLFRINRPEHQREEILTVSRKLVTLLTNYDGSTVASQRPQVLALATGAFLQDYQKRTGGNFNKTVIDSKTISKGTIRVIGITSLKGNNAAVVAVVDHTFSNVNQKTPRFEPTVISLSLVHTTGGWRVDDFGVLGVLSIT